MGRRHQPSRRDRRPPAFPHPTRAQWIRRRAGGRREPGVLAVSLCSCRLVVRRRDRVVLKEPRRPAGVFGRDQGHFAQDAQGPQRDILEVADGCRDHIEGAGHDSRADCTQCIQPNPCRTSSTSIWRISTRSTPRPPPSTASTCTTTCSRTSAGRPSTRKSGPRRLRPAARGDRPGPPDRRRAARAAGARIEHPRAALRARGGAHVGAQPATLRRHPGHQPGRPGALRLRPARRARAARPLEAAAGAAPDAGGARQHQGSARHLRQGRPGKHARHAALHPRGPAARVRRPRRPAPARRPRGRGDRSVGVDRRLRRVPRDATSRRAARARSASGASGSSRSSSSTKASRSAPSVCWRLRTRELQNDAGGVPPRRVARQRRRSDGGLAEGQSRSSARRPARRGRAAAARRARGLHPPASGIITIPEGAPVDVRPTPRFYRWTFASMWTPGPFESRPLRAFYYITDVDPSWPAGAAGRAPARLQLRRAVVDLDSRGVPRPLPALSAPAAGRARSCASRSSSRRRRSSRAGRTTASR